MCTVLSVSPWALRCITRKWERGGEGRRWMGGFRQKPERVRPHLEAELAASGPWAVTQCRSYGVVPRTLSSGETEKNKCKREAARETESYFFTHTILIFYLKSFSTFKTFPLLYIQCLQVVFSHSLTQKKHQSCPKNLQSDISLCGESDVKRPSLSKTYPMC